MKELILRTLKSRLWMIVIVVTLAMEVVTLSGPNVCMVKQKYNITKRVKYRAPTSVRTYEWCLAMPPRCSKWTIEMRENTRLETEERTAEMAVCCPGYKMRDISCVPICPTGKTGPTCSEECPPNKWGPNCVHECKRCKQGVCSPLTGHCQCQAGWQGESCDIGVSSTASPLMEQLLTTAKTSATTQLTTQTPTTVVVVISTRPVTTTNTEKSTAEIMSTTDMIKSVLGTSTASPFNRFEQVTVKTIPNTTAVSHNATLVASTRHSVDSNTEQPKQSATGSLYNRTEIAVKMTKGSSSTTISTSIIGTYSTPITMATLKTTKKSKPQSTSNKPSTADNLRYTEDLMTTALTKFNDTTIKMETTRKTETTKQSTTTKYKPKEIWIKPAQKGEPPSVESKIKIQELPRIKNQEFPEMSEVTTPKTIIVSIIPTSLSNVSFKRIALTTAFYLSKNDVTIKPQNQTIEKEYTKPMITTSTPFTVQILKKNQASTSNPIFQNATKTIHTSYTRRTSKISTTVSAQTNSMTSTLNIKSSSLITPSSTNVLNNATLITTSKVSTTPTLSDEATPKLVIKPTTTPKHFINKPIVNLQKKVTVPQVRDDYKKVTKTVKIQVDTNNTVNVTNNNNKTNTVVDNPKDEETFHILTEPEHITAVMGEKGNDRTTADLISVLSIAGGVMMAIITVAVVIVMLERCKKPRYEDVRKYNDIRMQVMIDKNDVSPPPYVRSIFHTPLPDPPNEKCHYQPISTLDRNLKQFMRPVVVQTISPLMLENFRGILECHYDHLPHRNHEMGTMTTRCSITPSIEEREELLTPRAHSLTDSTIEALKCEAKLDVIDNTTSEPLYAEIPCWRPPSEHAVEIISHNGEAVTEL